MTMITAVIGSIDAFMHGKEDIKSIKVRMLQIIHSSNMEKGE